MFPPVLLLRRVYLIQRTRARFPSSSLLLLLVFPRWYVLLYCTTSSPGPPISLNSKPFADFMPTRRRSAKKRKEGAPPSRPHTHAVATPTTRVDLPKKDSHFSTADRTILQELKLGTAVRESQFKMKASKKHHPYPAKEAPYPLNYERPVIDQFVLLSMWLMSMPTILFPIFTAMSGRQCSSSNCLEVRPFMCLTLHPQKCTSLSNVFILDMSS